MSSFLYLVEKNLVKHWDREKKCRIFSRCLHRKIPQDNRKNIAQNEIVIFCAAHKGDFFASKQVYLSAHEV